jgi:FkbM family methyltransferase
MEKDRVQRAVRILVPRAIRNSLRSPARSAAWTLANLRYWLGIKEHRELRPGFSLVCHPGAYRFSYYAQQEDPEQVAELDSFISWCRPGMILFDIGAHFGIFSLAALRYGGATARAVAVDPSPMAARMLRIQAALNGAGDKLRIIQAAVGDTGGELSLVAAGPFSSGYLGLPTSHPRRDLTRVCATTLDNLSGDLNLFPTHIKVDVEGSEAAVLRGGQCVLTRVPRPVLFLELHNNLLRDRGADPEETLRLLAAMGYHAVSTAGLPLAQSAILDQPIARFVARASR